MSDTKVVITDKMPLFKAVLYNVLDDALGETAKDILIDAKNVAPFRKGALRRESDVSQASRLKWIISFWVEYARFQEFGGDGRRRVRNYSTAGTGAHFLQKSGDRGVAKIKNNLVKHSLRAKV